MYIYDYPCAKAFIQKCFVSEPEEWRKENALDFVCEMGQYVQFETRFEHECINRHVRHPDAQRGLKALSANDPRGSPETTQKTRTLW